MKGTFRWLIVSLLMSLGLPTVYAASPVCGWYAGMFLGGSYAPQVKFRFTNPFTRAREEAALSYSGFGNIGAQFGYRLDQLRMEIEGMINSAPYKSFRMSNDKIRANKKSVPGLRFTGATNTGGFLFNIFYDLFVRGGDTPNLFPYVGVGVGGATVKNNLKFYDDNVLLLQAARTNNTAAAQAIVGAGYFLDDYTTAALDVRYFTTKKITLFNARSQFASVNITVNGSF